MSAHKKNWVYRDGIANPKFTPDETHGDLSCTACHGGEDGTADPAAAHAGRVSVPGASRCADCHPATVTLAASSLHTTLAGYETILAHRGVDFTAGSTARERYDAQCTKCHAATAGATAPESACGHCHVSVPDTAGGGLIAGHRMRRTPDTANNCTACHGSRVKDEYYGLNNALLARNRAVFPADSPWLSTTLQPDVHRTGGMGCADCHTGGEMHGQGAGAERYLVTTAPACTDCHTPSTSVGLHTTAHLQTMDCQVCHAQPYKSCFGCHTDVTDTGAPFFRINEGDPTRNTRSPAWSATVTYVAGAYVTYGGVTYRSLQASNLNHLPDEASSTWWVAALPAGDSLMAFRVGKNPRFGEAGQKEYTLLRHAPVDADVFRYSGANEVTGLVPSLTAGATWKHATPHNVARVTPIQSACSNCHGANWAKFWLTDAVGDAHGWVGTDTAAQQAETDANAGVVQPAAIPF